MELAYKNEKQTFYTTIVTCYFSLNSKHSRENYKKWIHNMLSNIETGMIIFTDEEFCFFNKAKELKSSS